MGWMNCMSCGCQVHTSKLPINVCDDCEVMVDEVQTQSEDKRSTPETKEDILWIKHECEVCDATTGYLAGDDPHCSRCAIDDAVMNKAKGIKIEVPPDEKSMDELRREDSYCLCEHLNTDDPETLQTITKECAALGCNVCLGKTTHDIIEWPKHYNTGKIQPIDVIEDWKLDFRLANSVKYIARAGKKDPEKTKQDLEKAIWYIKRFIDKEC